MTDPEVQQIIANAIDVGTNSDFTGEYAEGIANAIVGALALRGYAIIPVDPRVLQRVLAEMSKELSGER